jgi:hypothetical protein
MRAVAGNFLGASATLVNIKVRGITPRTQKLFGQLDRVGCRCGGTQRQPEKARKIFMTRPGPLAYSAYYEAN